MRADVKGRNN